MDWYREFRALPCSNVLVVLHLSRRRRVGGGERGAGKYHHSKKIDPIIPSHIDPTWIENIDMNYTKALKPSNLYNIPPLPPNKLGIGYPPPMRTGRVGEGVGELFVAKDKSKSIYRVLVTPLVSP